MFNGANIYDIEFTKVGAKLYRYWPKAWT